MAAETHGMLVQVYDGEAESKTCVREWFKHFRDGKDGVEDEPCSGSPFTSITPDNIERVLQMILADSQNLTLADFYVFPRLKLAMKG
ncbi:hypothetical protein C0J52_17936 [Blattella germanica]|nr:hypothetical protein C0J52_17936 [Blattella germanica]